MKVRKANNFDILRLLASSLVVFAHSFALLGMKDPLATHWFQSAGSLGVDVFFAISGFLISRSLVNGGSLRRFAIARVLRIFPGLLFCCVVLVFAGFWMTSLPAARYLSDSDVLRFLFINPTALWMTYGLPGVFPDHFLPGVVNGSLWTLPVEIRLYVLVAACGLIANLTRLPKQLTVLAGMGVVTALILLFSNKLNLDLSGVQPSTSWWRIIPVFCIGGMCSALNIERHRRVLLAIAALSTALAWFGFRSLLFLPSYWLAIVTLTLAVAYAVPAVPLKNDCSYGVYIWAFPIQQGLIAAGIGSAWQLFVVSLPVVMAVGMASWLWVERPAMTKPWVFATASASRGS